MVLPRNRNDKENARFAEDADGKVGVHVVGGLKTSTGSEIAIDSNSRVSVRDTAVQDSLIQMLEVLNEINFKLGVIIDG